MAAITVEEAENARVLTLAALSPVTYDIAVKAFGQDPDLCDDVARAAFFSVWALLKCEFADAMVEALRRQKELR